MQKQLSSRARRHSTVRLPPEAPPGVRTVFDFFLHRFPGINRYVWHERFLGGKIFSRSGIIGLDTSFEAGIEVFYFREVETEPPVRRDYRIIHRGEDLLVVDKPPHLPVIPGGSWINNSLLMILEKEEHEDELAPLHRIDRLSSGLLIFSRRKTSRRRLSKLFQPKPMLSKEYLVVCEYRQTNPPSRLLLRDHIRRSESAWWKQEIVPELPPNAVCEARLEFYEEELALYRIRALKGRKHQLRVQLARAGLPVLGDPIYGTRPRHEPEDISTRMFLDAHLIHIGDFSPIQGCLWFSRETPRTFFDEAIRASENTAGSKRS